METEFTLWASLAGGILIGIASVLLMLFHGRIMGATAILSGAVFPESLRDWSWRAALIAGMATAPLLLFAVTGELPAIEVPMSLPVLLVGGFIVGLGVTFGNGCTSGHGVCGMARFSRRSIAATITFMLATGVTVYVVRHLLGG